MKKKKSQASRKDIIYLSNGEFSAVLITQGMRQRKTEMICWEIKMHCKESVVRFMTLVGRMMSGKEIGKYFGDKIGLIQWSKGRIQEECLA